MGIIRTPRVPLTPADVIKRIPRTPADISINVKIPDGTGQVSDKGRPKQKTIKLYPRE